MTIMLWDKTNRDYMLVKNAHEFNLLRETLVVYMEDGGKLIFNLSDFALESAWIVKS